MRTVIAGGLLLAALAGSGCRLIERLSGSPALPRNRQPPKPGPPTYSHYQQPGWQWGDVSRVLVLPPRNESAFTRAGEELHAALCGELQRLGRFEVVQAPPDPEGQLAKLIHVSGRFDEGAMLDLGKLTRADVVVFPTITQYSPYPRPRLGVVLQAVAPLEGKVIASVDGLWDTTDAAVAEQVRTHYRQRPTPLPAWVRNHEIATDDSFAGERALDSPALFQRYVCHVGARVLVGLPEAGGVPMQTGNPIHLPRWRPGVMRAGGTAPCDGCEPTTGTTGQAGGQPPQPGAAAPPAAQPPVPMPPVPMPPVPDEPKLLPRPRPEAPDAIPPGK
jgi:hypothetical protein